MREIIEKNINTAEISKQIDQKNINEDIQCVNKSIVRKAAVWRSVNKSMRKISLKKSVNKSILRKRQALSKHT